MDKVVFRDNWRSCFGRAGLERVGDFLGYAGGRVINQNSRRQVVAFALAESAGRREFFMKRFHRPHYKDMLFTVRNFGRPCSQGYVEWANAELLLKQGIQTYHPVCFGQRTVCGVERESFVVTEKLQGRCLTDYIVANWPRIDSDQRVALVVELAALVRKLHAAQISMPDLYMWHIFMLDRAEARPREYALIDLHRMIRRARGRREKVRNLGALFYTMLPRYLDDGLKEVFLRTYADGDGQTAGRLRRGIEARARALSRRRGDPEAAWAVAARR